MASLSHSERSTKDYNQWLELGLGFSIAPKKQQVDDQPNNPNINALSFPVSASSSSHLPPKLNQLACTTTSSTRLELGLSLAIDSESKALDHEEDHYDDGGFDDDDEDEDMAWWWTCHTNSSSGSLNDWQMPVPNNSHHYFTRTRPHSGLWFTLHSYTNRNGEALPQIPKAYIRVKDENVTIFMVKKYLVRKLGLSNEAEVEISCMGQRLLHTQTLKQVRDCVWFPSFHNYSLQSNSVNNHLMSLYYGMQCAFN